MADDKHILKGFLAGDSQACTELFTRLRPAILVKLRLHHSGLRHAFDEILDAAETRLFDWREKTLHGEGQIDLDESIEDLAWRLAKQEAESEGRFEERNPLATRRELKAAAKRGQPSDLTGDEGVNLGELEVEIDGLPEELGLVLMAEAQRSLAGAAPLHEQLGITPEAARKRLERARRELKERLRERDEEGQ